MSVFHGCDGRADCGIISTVTRTGWCEVDSLRLRGENVRPAMEMGAERGSLWTKDGGRKRDAAGTGTRLGILRAGSGVADGAPDSMLWIGGLAYASWSRDEQDKLMPVSRSRAQGGWSNTAQRRRTGRGAGPFVRDTEVEETRGKGGAPWREEAARAREELHGEKKTTEQRRSSMERKKVLTRQWRSC